MVAPSWPMPQRRALSTVPVRFAVVAACAVVVGALHVSLRPRSFCWLRTVTGVPCPFCGGTTAMVDLGHGDWGAALAASPLAVALAAVVPFTGVVRLPSWAASRVVRASVIAAALAGAEVWELVRFGLIGA